MLIWYSFTPSLDSVLHVVIATASKQLIAMTWFLFQSWFFFFAVLNSIQKLTMPTCN